MGTETKHRREFLAWLLAVPTIACGSSSPARSGAEPNGQGDHPHPEPEAPGPDAIVLPDGGAACPSSPTLRDLEGPYYEAGAPVRAAQIAPSGEAGVRLLLEGRIVGPGCRPLAGYALDVWQANKDGHYYGGAKESFRLRGRIVSDGEGRYRFETIVPGRYGDAAGIRPAHLHVKVRTPSDGVLLTTQLYFAGDPYLGTADYCTRGGSCNSNDPGRILALSNATIGKISGKRATFDAVLDRT